MTLEELERDVAELKAQVAGLLARLPAVTDAPKDNWLPAVLGRFKDDPDAIAALRAGPDPYSRWWENLGPPLSDEAASALDDAEPYTRYFRQTGEWPPPGWNPGDPIPEPDHWK